MSSVTVYEPESTLTGEQLPLEAMVSLVMTFNQGIELERLSGVVTGHVALMEWIDGWLLSLERRREVRDGRGDRDI